MSGESLVSTTPQRPGGVTGKGFMPGKSGNPSGRRTLSEVERAAQELAANLTPEGLLFLANAWRNKLDKPVSMRDRITAAKAVAVDLGHARAVPNDPLSALAGFEVRVVQYVVGQDAKPVPGVINSPIKEHVCLPSIPRAEVVNANAVEAEK